jgi:hypothetical protein
MRGGRCCCDAGAPADAILYRDWPGWARRGCGGIAGGGDEGIEGKERDVTREQVIERLRVWAARANSEALEADTPGDQLNWTGQAQVLGDVAAFLASQGSGPDLERVRLQVIGGRQQAIAAWELARENPRDLALHAGEVAGYDITLVLLRDVGSGWAA